MSAITWSPTEDMPDLRGKIAVVTGGSSGLGLHVVKHLASKGAEVYFTARSEAKARNAFDQLRKLIPQIPDGKIHWIKIDLTDLESVLEAAERLKSKVTKIDILVNNAGGTVFGPYQASEAGWEMAMLTNYIGHFVFTNAVWPLIKAAAAQVDADVRIAMTSSDAPKIMLPQNYTTHYDKPEYLALKDIKMPFMWRYVISNVFRVDMVRYSISKLAVTMFAQELQRRIDVENLPCTCVSLNPGSVLSDDVLNIFVSPMRGIVKRQMISMDQGSFNTLFATTSQIVKSQRDTFKGRYLEPIGQPQELHPVTADEKQVQGLWDVTTSEVNKYLATKRLTQLSPW